MTASGNKSFGRHLWDALTSFKLALLCLIGLFLLTWAGTMQQRYEGLFEVQKRYFEGWFVVHDLSQDLWGLPIRLPLLGGMPLMLLLMVNLVCGGIVRIKKSARRTGILITHLGILFLMTSALVKYQWSESGFIALYEQDKAHLVVDAESSSRFYTDFHYWEIAVTEVEGDEVREHLFPESSFADAIGGSETIVLKSKALPFSLEIRHLMANCQPNRKGPMFEVPVPVVEGWFLREVRTEEQQEMNVMGCYATVPEAGGAQGILWGLERAPWTVPVGGVDYLVALRRVRRPLPFSIQLDRFVKEDHPGVGSPKRFSSFVTVAEDKGAVRDVHITMNRPLRKDGYVFYQASWGPSNAAPGEPLFSQFEVSWNPSDAWPMWACGVIGLGMLIHFSSKLTRYLGSKARRSM